jgi:hypothetical protein
LSLKKAFGDLVIERNDPHENASCLEVSVLGAHREGSLRIITFSPLFIAVWLMSLYLRPLPAPSF